MNDCEGIEFLVVHTSLDGRQVIRKCRESFEAGEPFEFAVKWVPVDVWCETSLDAMKAVIEQWIKERIEEGQTWAMQVEKRGWRQYHAAEIIQRLASGINRKVDLGHPDKILRIDVLGPVTAISLLRPDKIFSILAPRLR
jgi:tRNA acetyltransferase TAN1